MADIPNLRDYTPSALHPGVFWLNWTFKNGRKVPVDSVGQSVGYSDPRALTTIDEAIARHRANPALGAGISLGKDGLRIGTQWVWCLDFDGFLCRLEDAGLDFDNGVVEFLEDLGTWVEVSPSETGAKAFFLSDKKPTASKQILKFGPSKFRGQFPEVRKYQHREVEVFSKGFFLTTTGERLGEWKKMRVLGESDTDELLDRLNVWAVSTGGEGFVNKIKAEAQPRSNAQNDSAQSAYAKPLIEDMATVLLYLDAEDEQVYTDTANGLARTYGEDGRKLFLGYCARSTIEKHQEDLASGVIDERYNRALRDVIDRPEGYTAKHIIELAQWHPDWPQNFRVRYEAETAFGTVDVLARAGANPKQLELPIKDALVDAVNKEFLWDTHGLQIFSLNTRMYVRKDGFMSHYQNQQVPVGSRSVGLGSYWMKSPNRRNVNGLALAPREGEITYSGAFNTWRGYSCEPIQGDIMPFTEVFTHLLPDKVNRDFILLWLATAIQTPEVPFKVALAIHGRTQGTGKNTIFEAVGELLHRQHWCVIGNAQLTSTFNEWQLDKVFVIGDEVSSSSSRSEADLMKRYITATENCINPKGLPGLRQPNLIKYVLLSNRDEIVHIEGEDRRYYVAETTDAQLPKPMADRFYTWKKAGGLSHLLHHLQNFDVSAFDPTAPAPMTNAKEAVIEAGKSGLDVWIEEEITERIAKGSLLVSIGDVLNAYQQTTRIHSSDKAVGNALKRAGGLKVPKQALLKSGRRIRLHSLADHEKYQSMSESELGRTFEGMFFSGR